jgi:hypothetical protein
MFGRTVLSTAGIAVRVSADGHPEYKAGGVTIDWNTVVAVTLNTTLPIDNTVIYNGNKYLRYGQILCRINGTAIYVTPGASATIALNVSNTFAVLGQFWNAGTGGYNLGQGSYSPAGGVTGQQANDSIGTVGTYQTISFSNTSSAATVQNAINQLSNMGLDVGGQSNVYVVANGSGYTVTFARSLGPVTIAVANGTAGVLTAAANNAAGVPSLPGFFGPYDPNATDGRQTLTRGDCFVVDENQFQYPAQTSQLSGPNDQITGVFDGGSVFKARLLIAFAAQGTAASLAAGPTESAFLTAFPAIRLTKGNANI